jgi:SAM-dependent methyltransferase
MGHLARCVRLARELGRGCGFHPGWLDASALDALEEMLARFPAASRPTLIDLRGTPRAWGIVVVDKRRTTREELAGLERLGTVVCLDEGGDARTLAPYLVDALPRLSLGPEANTTSLSYLGLPRARRLDTGRRHRIGSRSARVLVSFGGEDTPDLTGTFLEAAIDGGLIPARNLTVVAGPLFGERAWPEGIRVVRGVRRVSALFARHDLLVTHFGISALEALAMGLPVVLFNPSAYHRNLARVAGIPEIGVSRVDRPRLRSLLDNPHAFASSVDSFREKLDGNDRGTLARHLGSIAPTLSGCPACGATGPVAARFPLRTYRHCPRCRIDYLQSFAGPGRTYAKGYFYEEYKAQYGRTYLEDFASIEAVGRTRIALIERALGPRALATDRGTIVDVGCAYGPFLSALKGAGWPCFGIDVAADAVEHVRKVLHLPAACLPLEKLQRSRIPGARVDGITLWYVIEHLDDLDAALRRIRGLLGTGGVLAFSTPNGRGISARSSRTTFLAASPPDHRSILSPRGLRKLLARHGFRLSKLRVTGHHPERFPGPAGRWGSSRGIGRSLVLAASRLAGLGDTFEAYAVRTR